MVCKMMIGIILGLILSIFNNLKAQTTESRLVLCLGSEEEKLFKAKIQGPIVNLNKELLGQMVSVEKLVLKSNYYKVVCKNRSTKVSPSLKLLELILTRGPGIFTSTSDDTIYRGFQQNFLEDLQIKSGKIFLKFLSELQATTAIANCLNEEIPLLGQIAERYKVLETDIQFRDLIKSGEVPRIFKNLEQLNRIYKSCEQRKKKYIDSLDPAKNPKLK